MEENLSPKSVLDEWNEDIGKVGRFKSSDVALKVLVWRYYHMSSADKELCSSEAGVSMEGVEEWWNGIDYVLQYTGGCHLHIKSSTTLQQWRETINSLLEKSF